MEYNKIGLSQILVSKLCLGTMTFGGQNNERESHDLIDFSLENGINFIDLAEMYPIPSTPYNYGQSEEILGSWLKKSKKRSKIIVNTKISGPNSRLTHIREGKTKFQKQHMIEALDGSLRRLKSDYIDIYMLHWPERNTGVSENKEHPGDKDDFTSFSETLMILQNLIQLGKIRSIGISNESAWGLMKYLWIADKYNLPKVSIIQNPYNLLNRTFEINMPEICYRENVGLMAYSPLGFGTLTGKYLKTIYPINSRLSLFKQMNRYSSEECVKVTRQYVELAKKYGFTPTQLALSFVIGKKYVSSTVIGCTNIGQLKENISAVHRPLNTEILRDIEEIHKNKPNPTE